MTYKNLIKTVLISAMIITLCALIACKENKVKDNKVYKIGYMICNSVEETDKRFLPLTNYLSENTGYKFEMISANTQDFTAEYEKQGFDFTHTNSYLYYLLKKVKGTKYLSTEKRGIYGPKTKGVLFALKSSEIKNMNDIKGKRVIFGPVYAPFAFISQYNLLAKNGIDPDVDVEFSIPSGTFKHEKAVYKVLFEQFDVGGVASLDLANMTRRGMLDMNKINIIAEGPLLPYCTFGYNEGTPKEVVKSVKQALLDLTEADVATVGAEQLSVLKHALIDGYTTLDDSEYDIFDEYAKRAKLPPYEDF